MALPDSSLPVVIIGAGLAGLNCARILHERGYRLLLVDADGRVGGRVQTDTSDGFRLDRGFQVFQTAYPEAQRALRYESLNLTCLDSGALIRHRGRWVRMADPWRQPQHALSTLFNSVGHVADRWRLFLLRRHVLSKSAGELLAAADDCTTREYLLERWRFSQNFYDLFLKPWWSGIFLETELATSAAYFQFVFHMLAAGDVALPVSGMQAIPNQLAEKLPSAAVRLSQRVARVDPQEVVLASGEVIAARAVVIATDIDSASKLIEQSDATKEGPRAWSSTACLYYAAPRPPLDTKLLMLRGDSEGPINHVFIPSNSLSSYAPAGQALISVSLVHCTAVSEILMSEVQSQLRALYGGQVETWRFLRSYLIPHALPKQLPGFARDRAANALGRRGLFRCGDYCETSSIQGALISGRKAADSLVSEVGPP